MSKAAGKKAPTDIFAFDPESACQDGADLELRHPATKERLGIFLVIKGRESDEFKNLVRRKARQNVAKGKGFREKSEEEQVLEVLERQFDKADAIDTAQACVVGWWRFEDEEERTGRIDRLFFEGADLEFSPDAGKRVFSARPWVAEQASEGVADLGNFMRD